MEIYDIRVKTQKGEEISLEEYRGKVLLIVNTATKCGFTKQYDGLQELYAEFKDKGFEILDFPCNQFFHQAPGSDEEIHGFCTLNFGIGFPQFSKIEVNGKNEHPLYSFLKERKPGRIKWNFTKFLVDRNGVVVDRFGPSTKPSEIYQPISQLL